MNKIYRLVWSRTQNAFVPVSEIASGLARGGNKNSRQKLLATTLTLCSAVAQANPSGGVITAGTGRIDQSGNTTTIHQNSQNLSLNWNSFNIGSNEIVNYIQPSASSIAVNRILDTSATQILGQLNANGQVYLINPNGIVFGEGSQVNVGGLVASTLDINDASLTSNTKTFSGTGTGIITNKGTIVAADGGYIALLANQVSNQGIITAQLGTVALAGGSAVTLTFSDNSLVQVQVNQSTLNNLAENKQLVVADGGQVFMSAGAKNSLLASVVNNTGIVEAQTVSTHNGVISLLGGMEAGTVNVAGKLDASAPNGGNGGAIETSAAHVKVAEGAQITTAASSGNAGSWLIDPTDFTIASTASGTVDGSGTPLGDISGTTLSTALGSGDVTILSSQGSTTLGSGNINVNDTVTWSANNTLTLIASNNVNVNAPITANGTTAGISINPNTANGTETASGSGVLNIASGAAINLPNVSSSSTTAFKLNGTSYNVINSLGLATDATGGALTLQGLAKTTNLGGYYVLGSNINASATGTGDWYNAGGFTPIGNYTDKFTGVFNGLGHNIGDLTINRTGTDYIGLFGEISSSAAISNVGLVGGSIQGNNYVGGLVAYNNGGTVSYSYVKGNVTITGNDPKVGGLVGINSGTVRNSYIQSTGNVTGGTKVGGLVGENWGTIDLSYSLVTVNGNNRVGGLVGLNYGTIDKSYSNSLVNGQGGQNAIGGLVGLNYGSISNSYATGNLPFFYDNSSVGGLVGENNGGVSKSYATGSVNGSSFVGGLIGTNGGTVNNSFYNSDINPTLNGIGNNSGNVDAVPDVAGTVWGMSTTALQTQTNFINATGTNPDHTNNGQNPPLWDFTNIWGVNPAINQGLPYFISLPITTIYLDLIPGGSSVYGSTPTYTLYTSSGTPTAGTYVYSTSADYTAGSLVTDASSTGTITWSGSPSSASNVGTYNLTYGSGITLGNSAYTLAAGNAASWSVNKANLILSGTQTYNGTTTLAGSLLTATGVNGQTFSVTGTGATALSTANVQTNQALANVTNLALGSSNNGGLADNYNALSTAGSLVSVTAADLTITGATTLASVYTGNAQTNTYSTSSLYGSDSVTGVSGLASRTHVGTSSDSLSAATGSGLSNYDISYVNGSLQVTPAHLTVTANDQSRLYGGVNPIFTVTLSGFVNGESLATSGVSGTASGFSSANVGTPVGTAVISASAGNLTASNYSFDHLVDGTLTIKALPQANQSVATQLVASVTTPSAPTAPMMPNTPDPLKVSYTSSANPNSGDGVSSGINISGTGIKTPDTNKSGNKEND